MIAYQEIGAGGGNLKTVKFTVPGNFWQTANSSPYTILGASKNHYHIPLSLTYYYDGTAIQVYSGGLYIASKEMYTLNLYWIRLPDPFQNLLSATGVQGVYQALGYQNNTAFCYINPIDSPQNDLYLHGSADDPLASMGPTKFELVYYTYKP